jgi:hypothetical protein
MDSLVPLPSANERKRRIIDELNRVAINDANTVEKPNIMGFLQRIYERYVGTVAVPRSIRSAEGFQTASSTITRDALKQFFDVWNLSITGFTKSTEISGVFGGSRWSPYIKNTPDYTATWFYDLKSASKTSAVVRFSGRNATSANTTTISSFKINGIDVLIDNAPSKQFSITAGSSRSPQLFGFNARISWSTPMIPSTASFQSSASLLSIAVSFDDVIASAQNTGAAANDPTFIINKALTGLNKQGEFAFLFPDPDDLADARKAITYMQRVSQGASASAGTISSGKAYEATRAAGVSSQGGNAARVVVDTINSLIASPNQFANVIFDKDAVKSLAALQNKPTKQKHMDAFTALSKVTGNAALRSGPRVSGGDVEVEGEGMQEQPDQQEQVDVNSLEEEARRRGLIQ